MFFRHQLPESVSRVDDTDGFLTGVNYRHMHQVLRLHLQQDVCKLVAWPAKRDLSGHHISRAGLAAPTRTLTHLPDDIRLGKHTHHRSVMAADHDQANLRAGQQFSDVDERRVLLN